MYYMYLAVAGMCRSIRSIVLFFSWGYLLWFYQTAELDFCPPILV